MAAVEEPSFWRCAAELDGAITRLIFWDVCIIGIAGAIWVLLYRLQPALHLQIGPVEIAGGVLGFMVVFRTNGGYERWWEGRRLWGQMTNCVRNLVQAGLAYGPNDEAWQRAWVSWCVAYPHACRMSLRSVRDAEPFERLLGRHEAQKICEAIHIPSYVAYRLATLVANAAAAEKLPAHALINMEALRAQLVDVIGGCERIASTPLPRVYILKFRRFIAVYLLFVPAALVAKIGWATPFLSMLVAYPALGLDRIAQELQSPFNPEKVSHLPLDSICAAIEQNGMGLLTRAQADQA